VTKSLRNWKRTKKIICGRRVRRLGIFGSFARGEQKGASDMDVLWSLKKRLSNNYMDLKFFLEDLFGCRVDLVISDAVKSRLRKAIFEETVYAKGL